MFAIGCELADESDCNGDEADIGREGMNVSAGSKAPCSCSMQPPSLASQQSLRDRNTLAIEVTCCSSSSSAGNTHNTHCIKRVLLQAIDLKRDNTSNTHNTRKQISLRRNAVGGRSVSRRGCRVDLAKVPTDCLQARGIEKARYLLDSGLSFIFVVPET